MQNSHLKNSLIAAGIAVFAGVVTLGANVAFGVTAPAQAPATAGLIAPTFSGLDVRGEIKNTGSLNNGNLTILDDLIVSGKIVSGGDIVSSKKLSSTGDTNVGGKLSVNYSIHSILDNYVGGNLVVGVQMVNGILDSVNGPTSQGGGALEVRGPITNSAGNVKVSDDLDLTGNLQNPKANGFLGDGALRIKDDLDVNGTLLNSQDVEIKIGDWNELHVQNSLKVDKNASFGPANNPDPSNNYFTVWANTNLKGVLDVVKDVVVHSNLNFDNLKGGSIGNLKNVSTAPGSNVVISSSLGNNSSSLTVHGDGTWNQVDIGTVGTKSNLNVNGNINAGSGTISGSSLVTSGDITMGNPVNDQKFLIHSRNNGGGDFLQITNDKADGSWDWNNGIVMKRGTVEGSPTTQLQVNGKITAPSIGTYDIKQSDLTAYAPNAGILLKTLACDAGGQIISCDGQTYYNGALNYDVFIGTTEANKTTNVCTVGARNGAYNVKFQATALCFYPNK